MPTGKYTQREVADLLEQEIIDNEMVLGVKLPSASQLAHKFGVSLKMADRALNMLVKRGFVNRIQGRGNFVKANRHLQDRLRVAFFFGIITDSMADFTYPASGYFVDMVCRKLEEEGIKYDLFSEQIRDNSPAFKKNLSDYDALLLPAGWLSVAPREIQSYKGNVILYGDDVVHAGPWNQIVYDYHLGFGKALSYCLAHRQRRFFLPGPNYPVVRHRHKAILESARSLGLHLYQFVTHYTDSLGNSAILSGRECAKFFLNNKLNDHVIISSSDFVTYGMMDVFESRHLVNNVDYRIISYDNFRQHLKNDDVLNVNSITHPLAAHADALCMMLRNISRKKSYYQAFFTPATEFIVRTPF